jgi:drug/metabolite transporter (DMT)-like permease
MLRLGVPLVFVLIWSTGFIVAKAVLPHADLQFFLIARFSLTAGVIGCAALILRAPWPGVRRAAPHVLAGALMQGIYLCASYWAITHGMAAGIMALLGALQPLFTALFSVSIMGKTLQTRAWLGLFIGFAGVGLVLAPKLITHGAGSLTLLPVAAALISVLAVTAGTIVQKWLAATDLRAAASIQSFGAALVAVVGALLLGTPRWDGSAVLWGALAWSVLVPSMVGTTLLMWMMRHGDATKVTALLLLVPPLAAVQAYLFFGERLAPLQFIGFALALGGVLMTRSAPTGRTPTGSEPDPASAPVTQKDCTETGEVPGSSDKRGGRP